MSTETANMGITNPELLDVAIGGDPEADLGQRTVPPEGDYDARFSAGERGVYLATDAQGQPKISKQGTAYYVADIQIELVAPGTPWDGYKIRDFLTSIIMPSVGTSGIADFCNKLGFPLKASQKLSEVPGHLESLLAQQPSGRVHIGWKAQKRDADTDQWVDVKQLNGARNFPEKADGSGDHVPEMEDPTTGERVIATAKVTRYLRSNAVGATTPQSASA